MIILCFLVLVLFEPAKSADPPIRFGKDGARLDFGVLHGYPTISRLIRTPAQTAGVVVAPGVTEDVVDFFSGE